MKVLSLFDGMSCWMIALNRAWIKVDVYYASEIDKYATQVSKKHYPNIVRLWDINNWREWDLWEIDLIIWWSPCQWFSFAWKQLAFDDPRSKLFFTMVDIINHYKPKYFLLENVKMKKEFQDVITQYMWVQPIEINSALVSAQNRKRLYWTNIPWVKQPEDKNILLKDILETEVDEKYYLTKEQIEKATYNRNWKIFKSGKRNWSLVLDRNEIWKALALTASTFGVESRQWNLVRVWILGKWWQWQRVYDAVGKSVALSALWWWQGAKTWLYAVAQRWRYNEDGKIEQNIECSWSEKANTITSVQKDSMILDQDYRIRRLTPIECERLQTVPDNYTAWVSNSQRYKMLGNWWTVDIISHILWWLTTQSDNIL